MVVKGIARTRRAGEKPKMQENRTRREAEDGNENKLLEIMGKETKKNRGKECD